MRMIRNVLPVLATAAVVAMTGSAMGSIGQPIVLDNSVGEGRDGIEQFGNIRHVANIGDDSNWSGSDIEFASREVVKLSEGATGDPVCETDADGNCLVDENGEIVYQTEVRDFAVAGGYGQVARIIDITDPENPVHVVDTPCNLSQNDIQIKGDLLLVARDGTGATAGSCTLPDGSITRFNGSAVLDFSDPRNPTYLSRLQYTRGSHNQTFHPTKPFVYLSDSDVAPTAGLGNIPIWDISDPANPTEAGAFEHLIHSPHDITFNADGSRAYVAAVTATYILNTEDPANPSIISTIANEGVSISHQSDPTPDGNYLLISDELGGGAAGVSPGGPVHVYDIRNEAAPVKIGVVENNCLPQSAPSSCHEATDIVPTSTAHVFRINPDGWTMAIAWYKDGIFVVDYSGLIGGNVGPTGETTGVGARVIAGMRMPGANSWAAKMWQERHPGYVFVNDIARGFDVFHVPELDTPFLAFGAIRASNPSTYGVGAGVTQTDFTSSCDYAPQSQGVDAWVQEIPSELADGKHRLTAAAHGLPASVIWDLDMYFYDENCALLGASEETGSSETGDIPEETSYVLVANFWPVHHNMHIKLTTSSAS